MRSRELILAVARDMFRRGTPVASPALAFLSIPVVAVFQFPAHLLNRAGHLDAGILANELLAVLAVPLIVIFAMRFDSKRLLPLRAIGLGYLAAFLVAMLGVDVVIDYLTHASEIFFPLPDAMRQQLDKVMFAPDWGTFAVKLFVLCIVPAVCEEIYFRGFMQTSLSARWGDARAIAITALVFAAMHGNIHYFHLYFLLGLFFGWAYAMTGTLWASIACHIFNNAWTFVNHTRGFELPLEGAPFYANAAILVAGLAMTAIAALIIQRRYGKARR